MSTKSKAAAAEEKKPITLSSEHVPLSYRIKKDLQRNGMIYAMLIPVLVYYAIFKFGPMFGLYISFIDYKPARGILAASLSASNGSSLSSRTITSAVCSSTPCALRWRIC